MNLHKTQKLVASARKYEDDDLRSVLAETADAGDLAEAAIALAQMRYEYAVLEDVGYWRQRGEWLDTFEEAASYRDIKREDAPMCIVRRLVSEPEVVE